MHTIIQNCITILSLIDICQRGIFFDDCRNLYKVGCSTVTLIMKRDDDKNPNNANRIRIREVSEL